MAAAFDPNLTKLPVADRLRLIQELWDSLDAEDLPLQDWQREELDKRIDDLDSGASVGTAWAEVRDRIVKPR